jgi:hypothetical protein
MPSAPVPPPESVIQQPQVDWQTAPGVHTPEPVIAPEPESYIPVQQEQWQQPYQPPQPASRRNSPQPYSVPEPVEPVQPYVEPQPEPEIVEEVKPRVHRCTILKKLKSAARVNASSWPPGISLCLNRCRSRYESAFCFRSAGRPDACCSTRSGKREAGYRGRSSGCTCL